MPLTLDHDLLITLTRALGGLGLFLLGMVLLTDNLKLLALDRLRDSLMRYTRTPLSGALLGASVTAILQSSSATTVAAVGFVGAGLMRFSNALGVIFGANVGTTLKGWLVALIGFKLQLGTLALPLVFIGALTRLVGNDRAGRAGLALAGFALIFVGIDQLQLGMTALKPLFSFDNLPADSLGGRFQLLLLGILFTLVTQSSSAGVATALTALYTGMIGFEQAAALVIGMDVGTTVTAYMATWGGSVGARRTGYSHVIYNLLTGLMALLLISPFIWLSNALQAGWVVQQPELALVAFHTGFNLLGVALILPFSRPFARLVESLVPDPSPSYTANLEPILLEQPEMALNALQFSIDRQLQALAGHLSHLLGGSHPRADLTALQQALDETHHYLDRLKFSESSSHNWRRLVAMLHCLDHMQRLHERCEEEPERAANASQSQRLQAARQATLASSQALLQALQQHDWPTAAEHNRKRHLQIAEQLPRLRDKVTDAIGHGELNVAAGTSQLEALRWLDRVSRHLYRISYHQGQAQTPQTPFKRAEFHNANLPQPHEGNPEG